MIAEVKAFAEHYKGPVPKGWPYPAPPGTIHRRTQGTVKVWSVPYMGPQGPRVKTWTVEVNTYESATAPSWVRARATGIPARASLWDQILTEAGIDDHDTAREDLQWQLAQQNGGSGPPPWDGGEVDFWSEAAGYRVSCHLEGFCAYLRAVKARSKREIEAAIMTIREEGPEPFRYRVRPPESITVLDEQEEVLPF